MPGSVNLGVTDDGECTGHEQAAQIARSPCLLMLPSLSLPPLECCLGTSPIQAEKLRPDRSWGQLHSRPERSPASNRPRECNEGACSSGWNDARP
jgi:hypothetical protein